MKLDRFIPVEIVHPHFDIIPISPFSSIPSNMTAKIKLVDRFVDVLTDIIQILQIMRKSWSHCLPLKCH